MTYSLSTRLKAAALGASALVALTGAAHADQVFNDDVIITGSLCVGFDCVNGESFGFDTIRLKENNTRIKFQDTSTSGSFPTNDWQLTANDSANGGANKFSIDDIDNGRVPFTLTAAARSNSIFVSSAGNVGFGTATPAVTLHARSGNTPTLRLEQDGSSGFAAQTWDVAGNETNFFVRDATNGSQLPLRIRPSAPSNSIFVQNNGDIGMGTASPSANLHIQGANDVQLLVEETGVGFAQLINLKNNGAPRIQWENTSSTGGVWQIGLSDPGDEFLIRDQTGGQNSFTLDASGNLTILGALTENSNKHRKMAIEPVQPLEILEKVSSLPLSSWTYKHDAVSGIRHIGPMAQDFHAIFGVGAGPTGISTLDTSGVALAAIQALNAENTELKHRLERLESLLKD